MYVYVYIYIYAYIYICRYRFVCCVVFIVCIVTCHTRISYGAIPKTNRLIVIHIPLHIHRSPPPISSKVPRNSYTYGCTRANEYMVIV